MSKRFALCFALLCFESGDSSRSSSTSDVSSGHSQVQRTLAQQLARSIRTLSDEELTDFMDRLLQASREETCMPLPSSSPSPLPLSPSAAPKGSFSLNHYTF